MRRWCLLMSLLAALQLVVLPRRAAGQSALSGDTIHISKAAGPITVDGDLSDEGWKGATRVDRWYETQPGDNLEIRVWAPGTSRIAVYKEGLAPTGPTA